MSLDTFLKKDSFTSNTSRGLIAGLLGGLAGTAVKSLVEHFLPVRKVEQRSAQRKILDNISMKVTGYPISEQNEALAEQLVNFPAGCRCGYGLWLRKKEPGRAQPEGRPPAGQHHLGLYSRNLTAHGRSGIETF